jgi:16S rRNA (cytosine1402-N4)-methyltransferase
VPADLPEHGHEPVLPGQTLEYLDPRPGQTVVDCTLGRGGHAALIAERLGPVGLLIGLDADPRNLDYARERLRDVACRTHLVHANFSRLGEVLAAAGVPRVHGILADLGVSTNQLLDTAYGLSFSTAGDGPLDMRLDPELPHSAADLLRFWSEKQIANVLYSLAQERYSRRIARKIVEKRGREPINTVAELADLVRSCVPRERRDRGPRAGMSIDPATRTFMALRMAVNRETEALGALLAEAPGRLLPGGRLVVISFHSGEDRLVKQAMRNAAGLGLLEIVTKRPVTPSDEEVRQNPRSRSAKLRAARGPGPEPIPAP